MTSMQTVQAKAVRVGDYLVERDGAMLRVDSITLGKRGMVTFSCESKGMVKNVEATVKLTSLVRTVPSTALN
jgi:hypothetical protein